MEKQNSLKAMPVQKQQPQAIQLVKSQTQMFSGQKRD
jgi:hypothetical protein